MLRMYEFLDVDGLERGMGALGEGALVFVRWRMNEQVHVRASAVGADAPGERVDDGGTQTC